MRALPWFYAALAILALTQAVVANARGNPSQNCDLQGPPSTATRAPFHGNEIVAFPNAPGPSYTGCIWLWVMSGDVALLEDLVRFNDGKVIQYRRRSRLSEEQTTECTYESGRLIRRTTMPSDRAGDQCPSASALQSVLKPNATK